MLEINEYFDGQVKSIGLKGHPLPATVGVISPGEYTFTTDAKEIMSIICGELDVRLPGREDWQHFISGQVFEVEAHSSFHLKVSIDTAYVCKYELS